MLWHNGSLEVRSSKLELEAKELEVGRLEAEA
jgi:hypothetical protein